MTDQTNGAEPPEEKPAPPLRDEICELLLAQSAGRDGPGERSLAKQQVDAIMHLLNERGHYLPGCPPAREILQDAQQFAGQFTLALLVVRLLRMLNTGLITPETKGMERWLNDYIDGRNHGPVGKPMLWPGGLKGLSSQLRQWGYQPTPTRPAFVARIPENPTIN